MSLNVNRRDLLVSGGAIATVASMSGSALAQNTPTASPQAAPADTSSVPNNEKRVNIVTLRDLEAEAKKVMAPFGYAYVSGGAGDEWTMRENLAAFNRWVINADFMNGTGSADTTTTLLGAKLSYPAITAPVGNQGSVHAKADEPNVKGTNAAGTLFCASSVSQLSSRRSRPRPKGRNGSSFTSQPIAALPASCCNAPRPRATRRSSSRPTSM